MTGKRQLQKYSPRGTRRLPIIDPGLSFEHKNIVIIRAILQRALQDWTVAWLIIQPDGKMVMMRPTKGMPPPWWVATYGRKFTTKMLKEDVEHHLKELRRHLGIPETWSKRDGRD